MTSGSTTIAGMAFGTLAGGVIIWAWMPTARQLTVFVSVVGVFGWATMFSGLMLGCPSRTFAGVDSFGKLLANFYQ